jgi:hypothetical protein
LEIEQEIDLGQIEEVIEIAKDERQLVDYYYGKLFIFVCARPYYAYIVLGTIKKVYAISIAPPPRVYLFALFFKKCCILLNFVYIANHVIYCFIFNDQFD